MSAISEILHEPQVQRWAMALMHFLWQGCFIVVTTSILLRMLREAAPPTRYATCLFAFAALTAAPLFTFMAIRPPAQAVAFKSLQLMHNTEEIVVAPIAATVVSSIDTRPVDTTPTILSLTSFDGHWETARTGLVAVWFLGEFLLGTWLLAGLVSLRVARRAAIPAPRKLPTRTSWRATAIPCWRCSSRSRPRRSISTCTRPRPRCGSACS